MCQNNQFIGVKMGHYKFAKGCFKMTSLDRKGVLHKNINTYGATFHPSSIRCNNELLGQQCASSGNYLYIIIFLCNIYLIFLFNFFYMLSN